MGAVLDILDLDLGQVSCPRGTTSQVFSRLLWNIFSKLRAELSS